jgi:hypothetical protein
LKLQEVVSTYNGTGGIGENFLKENTNYSTSKRKNDQIGLHQTKKLLQSKRVTKLKRLPTEWEKISVIYSPSKKLVSRIYRECKRINTPMKKNAHELGNSQRKRYKYQ